MDLKYRRRDLDRLKGTFVSDNEELERRTPRVSFFRYL